MMEKCILLRLSRINRNWLPGLPKAPHCRLYLKEAILLKELTCSEIWWTWGVMIKIVWFTLCFPRQIAQLTCCLVKICYNKYALCWSPQLTFVKMIERKKRVKFKIYPMRLTKTNLLIFCIYNVLASWIISSWPNETIKGDGISWVMHYSASFCILNVALCGWI